MIFNAFILYIFSALVFPPLCVPSIHGDSIYADAFQELVLKKTGIKLEKIGGKAYKFIPFVGREEKRNHFFQRSGFLTINGREESLEKRGRQNFPLWGIVLHDTVGSVFSTLNKFSDAKEPLLNAHYVITQRHGDVPGGIVIEMVPPEFLAQHAWPSWFRGQDNGNEFSIGIELVGKGFTDQGGKRSFYAYPESQVKSLGLLLQKLVKQYGIAPENIFSHGDFSPQRKYDVTILFPWKTLYEKYGLGMGLGVEERTRESIVKKYTPNHALPEIFDLLFFQSMLSKLGYDTRFAQNPELSEGSKKAQWQNVYQVFYAHFSRNGQPQRWRGSPDLQDMFWAWALVTKYSSPHIDYCK